MKLMNPTVDSKILIKKLINIINESTLSFSEYIRNYANFLDKQKINLFVKAKIDEKNWYNEIYEQSDLIKIITQINTEFDNLFTQ